jgi:hypothetical protein
MKNQTARFTCETDATFVISLSAGKKDYRIAPKMKEGADAKAKSGKKQYFDLTEAGEAAATTEFNKLVEDAKTKGWVLTEKTARASGGGFEGVPAAPKKGDAKPGTPAAPAAPAGNGGKGNNAPKK